MASRFHKKEQLVDKCVGSLWAALCQGTSAESRVMAHSLVMAQKVAALQWKEAISVQRCHHILSIFLALSFAGVGYPHAHFEKSCLAGGIPGTAFRGRAAIKFLSVQPHAS